MTTITLGIVSLAFLYQLFRDFSTWRKSRKGYPNPLEAWFVQKNFEDVFSKNRVPNIPIGKSELWYVVKPNIDMEFKTVNIRFVEPEIDRKGIVINAEFFQPFGFPGVKEIKPDKKGGIFIELNEIYSRKPPEQHLKIKLTVEAHQAGDSHVNFRDEVTTLRAIPKRIIIQPTRSETAGPRHQ